MLKKTKITHISLESSRDGFGGACYAFVHRGPVDAIGYDQDKEEV